MLMFGFRLRTPLLILTLFFAMLGAWAGSGPQNVLIVANANSQESLEIGNAYRRARNIPYLHLLSLKTATSFQVSYQTYLDEIEQPIRTYLKDHQLSDEITCIVLTRGVPQMVVEDGGRSIASLLAAMDLPKKAGETFTPVANPYYNAPDAFSHSWPSLKGLYLVTSLHGYHAGDVLKMIVNGTAADGTMPEGLFALQPKPRPIPDAEQLVKMLGIRNLTAEILTAPPSGQQALMAYFSGGVYSGINRARVAKLSFRPGAIVDMAQYFSAAPNNFDESLPPVLLPVSWFIRAEVTGIHGVVGDASTNAFPMTSAPQQLLEKYTAGFSLAESFYASLPSLNTQNLVIGDPLCAPYIQRPVINVEMETGPLRGIVPIRVSATSPIRGTTVSRMDVYVDGRFKQTIYEVNNTRIVLHIGEEMTTFRVPRGATLRTLLEGLAEAVNSNPLLNAPDGVRAIPSLSTSTLILSARKPGANSNDIPIGLNIQTDTPATTGILARMEGGWLSGGGQDPIPASATISFLGRRILPGDEVLLRIQQEHLSYTVPPDHAKVTGLTEALVEMINHNRVLQAPDGVMAIRGDSGMPYLTLRARTPSETGNAISFAVTVKRTDGSQLRAYPEISTRLDGGRDGSAASQTIHFMLGEVTARGRYLLNTTELADGQHQLRLVAYDGSLAQAQGVKDIVFTVQNQEAPPMVALPTTLPACYGEASIPVNVAPSVTKVDIFVDGQLLGSSDTAPFTVHIPLTTLGRGTHDLWAEGVDRNGNRFITAPVELPVLASPDVFSVTPNYSALTGDTRHRISGSGFLPDCSVRLAGIPAKSVKYLSPNLLDVTSDGATPRQGKIEVINPDGTASAPTTAFEYYQPRIAKVTIIPGREVLLPGQKAQFSARCLDQHDLPITSQLNWETTGGNISPTGLFTAGKIPGAYVVRANHADSKDTWEVTVVVGPAKISDGKLQHWLVIGPFPDPDYTALETALIAEDSLLPSRGELIGDMRWGSLYSESGFVDFAEHFSPNTNSVAYAHLYILAPTEMTCSLVSGSDDGIRIWMNGALVQSTRMRRPADPNQDTTPITLKAGWNRLLVKVDQGNGGWGFFMRLQADKGKRLPDLYYTFDNPFPPKVEEPAPIPPQAQPEPPQTNGTIPAVPDATTPPAAAENQLEPAAPAEPAAAEG